MRSREVRAHMEALALTPIEAARLFGVGLRSVRRWTQPERQSQHAAEPAEEGAEIDRSTLALEPGDVRTVDLIPGPAEQALRAWLKLHRLGKHWRPDGLPLGELDPLAALERVRERGGPRRAWDVDLRRCIASMDGHRVSFFWHPSVPGSADAQARVGWSLQTYSAQSTANALDDLGRLALIEDACACIARRLAGEREPPLPTLLLGEPELLGSSEMAPVIEPGAHTIELRDPSFSPVVVCRLSAATLAAFLERPLGGPSGVTAAQTLAFAQRHHTVLAELAAELHARPPREASPLGLRVLEISAGDLGLMRGPLREQTREQSARPADAAAGAHETRQAA